MTPISHALIPLALGQRWLPKREGRPASGASALVAIFGMLPDILNPHLALVARHASWSHTLWAAAGVAAILFLGTRLRRLRLSVRLAAVCAGAYLAHLVCDAGTGGVALFWPWSSAVTGGAWLSPGWWLAGDGGLLIWAYLTYRWFPLRARLRSTAENR